jgi:hypothetical protein
LDLGFVLHEFVGYQTTSLDSLTYLTSSLKFSPNSTFSGTFCAFALRIVEIHLNVCRAP